MTDLAQLRLRDYRPVSGLSAPSHVSSAPAHRSSTRTPTEVLRLVYAENARTLIPGLMR